MNRDFLKEAIADAKAVKETAIANAKAALEESFILHKKTYTHLINTYTNAYRTYKQLIKKQLNTYKHIKTNINVLKLIQKGVAIPSPIN